MYQIVQEISLCMSPSSFVSTIFYGIVKYIERVL
jgi:hypothetical protein